MISDKHDTTSFINFIPITIYNMIYFKTDFELKFN